MQIKVLRRLAADRTQVEAALDLGISYSTVKNHLDEARYRYNVHTTIGLVVRAIADGTISPAVEITTA